MPRVHVCVNALTATFGGGKTVITQLVGRLAALRPQWRFTALCSGVDLVPADRPDNLVIEQHAGLATTLARWSWEQRRLPDALRSMGADLLLNFGGYACFGADVPQVSVWQNPNVTTRARIPRSVRTNAYIRVQRLVQAASLRKAAFHVFPTLDAQRMAAARWNLHRYAHTAIHWGADELGRDAANPPPLAEREAVALAVGHTYYHKNYEALIDAMAQHRAAGGALRLVIAGGAYDTRHFERLRNQARRHGLGDAVEFRGALARDAVTALYRSARVYVTTSRLESFGLTPLEAMAQGTPVVAARASCLPEVCACAALYCDPDDPADVAARIGELASDDALAERLRERGFARVGELTWQKTAERYAQVLDAVLADPAAPRLVADGRRTPATEPEGQSAKSAPGCAP